MRSSNRVIEIIRDPVLGQLPGYIALAQRHLEKSRPQPIKHMGKQFMVATYLVPLDLVSMVLPAASLKDVESIELTYRLKPKKEVVVL